MTGKVYNRKKMARTDKDDTRPNKNDVIGLLIRAGLVAVAGYGVYRILRGFSSFKPGQQVSDTALLTEAAKGTDLSDSSPASPS